MSKLTVERAQERISHLKQWQEQRGLTLREEEYLEALETHLQVVSASPFAYYGNNAFYNTRKAAEKDGVCQPIPLYDLEKP